WRKDRPGGPGVAAVLRRPAWRERSGSAGRRAWRLLCCALGRRARGRLLRTRVSGTGLGRLDMSAEAEAHGREHLLAERMGLARAEAGIERGGEHLRRDGLLDRRLDGPATLAGILHEAGEILQLRILRQRGGAEIEQPRRDDAAAPPYLG